MQARSNLSVLSLLLLLGAATAAEAQVDQQRAAEWFKEVLALCERDASRLWGVSLCGPMVIVDRATRTRATSQPEPEGSPLGFAGLVDGPVTGPLEGTTLRGDGWSATLNSGWVVRPAVRPGSFTIVREN
jgi:hypothetical protein